MKLHDYQEVAVGHLQRNPYGALFLEMGLGKTAAALRALTPDHLPVLVVAPKRVTENVWPEEMPKWRPDLTWALAAGPPEKRARALRSGKDIIFIGRDNLADAMPLGKRFNTLILDELSGFKDQSSRRWRAARRILIRRNRQHIVTEFNVKHVWGLTGTPSPNGLMDLWAPMYLLDGGERLGRTLGGFRERYFTAARQLPNGVVTQWDMRPKTEKRIHKKISDICLSMEVEGRIDLPPVTYNDVIVPLNGPTRTVYKKMKKDLVVNLKDLGLMGQLHTAESAAVLSNRLSQITAGFMYHDDAVDTGSGAHDVLHREKAKAAQEIVEGTGSPVLMFYRYKAEADLLRAALGDQVSGIDDPDVFRRWNAGKVPVLLAHPESIGHGLNLQHGGHTIVWATVPWSLEHWQQGNGRLARQGQQHPVVIHSLISPATVDPAVQAALAGKTSIQAALMAHLDSPL